MYQKEDGFLSVWKTRLAIFAVFMLFMMPLLAIQANENPAFSTNTSMSIFADVPNDHQYRRDIIYLWSVCVLEESAYFRPNDELTIAEAIIMAEKMFGDESHLPEWGWWKAQEDSYKPWENAWGFNTKRYWLDNANTRAASREVVSHILLRINGEDEVAHPEYYGVTQNAFYKTYLTLYAKGYGDIEKYDRNNAKDPVTRGEYCHLLMWAKDHIHDPLVMPELDDIIRIDASQAENIEKLEEKIEYLKYKLCKIPEKLRKAFVDDGFVLQIVDAQHWKERFGESDVVTSGWFRPTEKVIAIHEKYCFDELTLPHEFGHYLDYKVKYQASQACEQLLTDENESDGLVTAARREYGLTSGKEFFADACWVYWDRPNDLQGYAPKTYQVTIDALDVFESNV